MATDELAARYGRPMTLGRRRTLIGAAAAVLVIALAYAGWYSLTTGNPSVTWQDIGYRNTSTGIDVTFEVTFQPNAGPADAAVCTVEALNTVRTVVGTRDVRVGPLGQSEIRTLRITASLRTSEPANTGLVETCVMS